MATSPRVCSECGNSLRDRGPQALTCSVEHRQARSRRLKREGTKPQRHGKLIAEHGEVARQVLEQERPAMIERIVEQELRPIVREALTETTLQALDDLMALTPIAVAAIKEDLESDDVPIRQRAYTLVTKYTIGHPALIRPSDADPTSQMTVHFNLPRPDDDPEAWDADAPAVEMKRCDLCNEEKPSAEMVAGASRCQPCMDRWKQEISDSVKA